MDMTVGDGEGRTGAGDPALPPAELLLIELTNAARRAARLRPLMPDAGLMRSAAAKCREMAESGRYTHECERWRSPLELQRAHGAALRVMGAENLACHRDLRTAFQAWMASPGHRANILLPEHDRIGVAALPGRGAGILACMEFGGT